MTQQLLFPDHKRQSTRHKSAIDADDQANILQWLPMLMGKARRLRSLQPADIDDARQEAALAAVLAVGTFTKGVSELQSHIGLAAECRLKTFEAKRKSRGFTGAVDAKSPLTTIGESVADQREASIGASVEQLRAALDSLPNDEYLVIVHRRISELSGAQVAAMLETTVDEIDRLEAAALERLGALLEGGS